MSEYGYTEISEKTSEGLRRDFGIMYIDRLATEKDSGYH